MARVSCPRCGYENPRSAPSCDICRTPVRLVARRPPPEPPPTAAGARTDFYLEQSRNIRRSWLLALSVGALLLMVCSVFGALLDSAPVGIAVGGFLAAGSSLFAYYSGARVVLAVSGAREAGPQEFPVLHNVVEEMGIASGLPKPSLHVIEDSAPNAFATGRDPQHAAIAVTRGLLDKLGRDELQGVVAHEMSHIRNLDIRFTMMVGILVGMVALLCDFFWRSTRTGSWRSTRGGRLGRGGAAGLLALAALLLMLLAPLFSKILQMAVSRRRELLADASAVELTRNPGGLADALQKIDRDTEILEVANRATQHLYIINPIQRFDLRASSLMSTHPPVEARIRILRTMA